LVHFLAASGVRVGAVPGIRFKDIERIENCYCVKVYAGTKEEYLTFLTPEATRDLDTYLKSRDFEREEEYLFSKLLPREEMMIFFMSYGAIRLCLNRIVRRAKLQDGKEGKRYDKPVAHAFRKRFNTILKSNKDSNANHIEIMMGHSIIAMDKHYLTPSKEVLFAEYKKGINELEILKKL